MIEDAAESLGTTYKGKMTGTLMETRLLQLRAEAYWLRKLWMP